VKPVPFEQIEEVIAAELKARPSRIFSMIDPQPLAPRHCPGAHGQLRDGRDVVIKVQRPRQQEEIGATFEAFLSIAKLGNHTSYGRKFHIEELRAEFKAHHETDWIIAWNGQPADLHQNLSSSSSCSSRNRFPISPARASLRWNGSHARASPCSPVIYTE